MTSNLRYRLEEWIGNFFHNSIIHPILPFLTKKTGKKLHDWSIEVWAKLGHYDVF